MAKQEISSDTVSTTSFYRWIIPDTELVIDSLCISLRGIFLEHLNKKNEFRFGFNEYFFTLEQRSSYMESEFAEVEDLSKISAFLNHLLLTIDSCVETCILLKIYLDRFLDFTQIPLCSSNWKDLVIVSTLTAQRVYKPCYLCNSTFVSYFPEIDKETLDFQEIVFLGCLDYQIKINAEDYDKCFHHLSLVAKNDTSFKWKIKAKDVSRIIERSKWIQEDYEIGDRGIVRAPKLTFIDLDELDLESYIL